MGMKDQKAVITGAARGMGRAIAPGPVATDMMGSADGQPKEDKGLPWGRFSLPSEIAELAVLLASPRSLLVNGQVIVANSGSS